MNLKNLNELTLKDCGHTADTHINVTDGDLVDRLLYGDLHEFRYNGDKKSIATKFDSESIALRAIKLSLEQNKATISAWTNTRDAKVISVRTKFQTQIGYGLVKGTPFTNKYSMSQIVVVLSLGYNGGEFNIITAYLEPNLAIEQKIQRARNEFMSNRKK